MMELLTPCDDVFSLETLADEIRRSSNFKFVWQFFRYEGKGPVSAADVRAALAAITARRELHCFLTEGNNCTVELLHEHCSVEDAAGEFENVLAAAAGDHLGAYSREDRDATEEEKERIVQLFRQAGPYLSFSWTFGDEPGCEVCQEYGGVLFTDWFYGVAWDWMLLAVWPEAQLLWMGCLTDVD